jgi:hypothetical protein
LIFHNRKKISPAQQTLKYSLDPSLQLLHSDLSQAK